MTDCTSDQMHCASLLTPRGESPATDHTMQEGAAPCCAAGSLQQVRYGGRHRRDAADQTVGTLRHRALDALRSAENKMMVVSKNF